MSTIGNRFMVSSIQDGTTIHGNLIANKTLTQAWDGSGASPNWTDSSEQPDISMLVYDGGTQKSVANDSGFTWSYNGNEIQFDSNGYNTAMTGVAAATFYKHYDTINGNIVVQKLKIVKNLASSANKDTDVIGFNGSVEIDGNYIGFSSSIQVRITEISANGYVGVLEYYNGKATINEQSESVKILASLYGGSAIGAVSTYYVKWYVNGVATTTSVVDTSVEHSITLTGTQVVDYATVKAEFYLSRSGSSPSYSYSDLVYTEVVGIDDTQDPEIMEIAASGPTSLRSGDSMTFLIWVRNRNTQIDTTWNSFKVQLLDSERNIITSALAGDIPNVISGDTQGWRQLPIYDSGANEGKAHIGFTYQVVQDQGRNIQGLVIAEQVQQV